MTVLVCCGVSVAARAEPPVANFLFPAGVARGAAATVAADGKFSTWPPKAWVDRAGLTVEPAAEQGQLTITAATDAEPGLYWLRLYDAEGAAKLRPFIVGTLAETIEAEPNNDRAHAQALTTSTTINGRLEKNDDVDIYALPLTKGQMLIVRMAAHSELGSPMDASLQICTQAGFVLAQNDDEIGLDPQLVFTAPRDDTYCIQTFAFPEQPNSRIGFSGAPGYVYRLTLTTGGVVDHTFPLALTRGSSSPVQLRGWNLPSDLPPLTIAAPEKSPAEGASITAFHPQALGAVRLPLVAEPSIVAEESSSPEQPQAVTIPVTITGCLESPRDEDVFQFTAAKGDQLVIDVEARSLGFVLEPALRLLKPGGELLREIDNLNSSKELALEQAIPADGEYRLVVRDAFRHGGFRYVYRMRIAPATPDFSLSVAAGEYVVAPGKPLEIPVTIARRGGFKDVIEISAADLPRHVSFVVAKSEATGPTAKDVKLTLTSTGEPWSGPIRIVGAAATPELTRVAQFSAGNNASSPDIWLTVPAKSAPAK